MMTRAEHLAWAKTRALAYLPNDIPGALASMLSDMRKHEETEHHADLELTGMLMMAGMLESVEQVRKHIEGFN
jgi:hypothetical protein